MLNEDQSTDLSDDIASVIIMKQISQQMTDLTDDMIMEKIINMNSKSHSPIGVDPYEKHMKFIYCIFKNYCKIGFISFGFIFIVKLIENFDESKFINFFKLIIRSGLFGLFWPISIFKLSNTKKIEIKTV